MVKVFETFKTEKGEVVIRTPRMTDAKGLARFMNKTSREEVTVPTRIFTYRGQERILKDRIKHIRKGTIIYLVCEQEGKIIGFVEVLRSPYDIYGHTAELSIRVMRVYQGLGIGTELMRLALEESRKNTDLVLIELRTAGFNEKAMNLYRKMGFKKAGVIPKGTRHKRSHKLYDRVMMYKKIR